MHASLASLLVSNLLVSLARANHATRAPNLSITVKIAADSPLATAQGWNLTSYHIGPCYDYAVFTSATGRTFYANGTADQFATHIPNILSDGGTPPWPWGFIINPVNATDEQGRRNVFINCGIGTPGVEIKREHKDTQVAYGTGEFFVCNSTLLYGPAITLYYRERGDITPQGCADVQLLTKCLSDGTLREFQKLSWCAE
jgi:hypothetical protein